jgi:hypothetical protein
MRRFGGGGQNRAECLDGGVELCLTDDRAGIEPGGDENRTVVCSNPLGTDEVIE